MKCFQIKKNKSGVCPLSSFQIIKEDLNRQKSKIDEYYQNDERNYSMVTSNFDPFRNFRWEIARKYNISNPSNAWLKCYEIISHFNLIPDVENLTLFDNASFPGSFVLAIHHYVKTMRPNTNLKWFASSLVDKEKDMIDDKYGLWKNYPKNWLMSEKNNGDVLNAENQKDFQEKVGKVDIYTSDLGFDSSSNFNEQELMHSEANLAQIVSGLLTLKKGGVFITKQYTFFEEFTLKLIAKASVYFHEFYIIKPQTSRSGNSEVYLLGINFRGISRITENKIFDSLRTKDYSKFLNVDFEYYSMSLSEAAIDIYGTQIKRIKENILLYKKYKESNKFYKIRQEIHVQNKKTCEQWEKDYKLKKIETGLKLLVVEKFIK